MDETQMPSAKTPTGVSWADDSNPQLPSPVLTCHIPLCLSENTSPNLFISPSPRKGRCPFLYPSYRWESGGFHMREPQGLWLANPTAPEVEGSILVTRSSVLCTLCCGAGEPEQEGACHIRCLSLRVFFPLRLFCCGDHRSH